MALLRYCKSFINKKSISSAKSGLKKEASQIIEKTKDFYVTNLKLGLYHFYKGNLSDAKMRFAMLKTLYGDKPLPYYNLARCYFIQGDYKQAKKLFEKAIKVGGRRYREALFFLDIIDGRPVEFLPKFVAQERFEYLAPTYVENYLVGRRYVGHKLILDEVNRLFNQDELKNAKILDLGCGTGVCCHFLKMNEMCKVAHGVDISPNMLAIAKRCMVDGGPVFEETFQQDMIEFLDQTDYARYNIILAADSFGYVGRLDSIIAKCSKLLAPAGVLILIVRSCQEGFKFDPVKMNFGYSVEYLREIALAHNLSISTKKCKFESSAEGILAYYKRFEK